MKRLIASVPRADSRGQPAHERLAVLVQALRAAEPQTHVVLQSLTPESGSGERRAASQLFQPLPGLPEAGSARIALEGNYLTRAGLEEFLAAGRSAGASLTALSITDRRFKAGFTIYGRI